MLHLALDFGPWTTSWLLNISYVQDSSVFTVPLFH